MLNPPVAMLHVLVTAVSRLMFTGTHDELSVENEPPVHTESPLPTAHPLVSSTWLAPKFFKQTSTFAGPDKSSVAVPLNCASDAYAPLLTGTTIPVTGGAMSIEKCRYDPGFSMLLLGVALSIATVWIT
jgi:hypothetical protein